MKAWKHIVVEIEQDDNLKEVVEKLKNIQWDNETLYVAKNTLHFFNKTKKELCPEDDVPPYEQENK